MYFFTVAEIVMEAARRASDIVTSPSSSDRDVFPLVPELDSAQFSALMDSHRRATQDRTPLVRSATAPPVAARTGFSLAGTAPCPLGMHRTRSLPLPNSAEPCLLAAHMLSATDAFPDMTPADLRHTQVVIGDHFSDIDEDEQEDEATPQSLDMGTDDGARTRTNDVPVIHGMCDDTVAQVTVDVATPVVSTDDALSVADPHRDTRAGSCSASRLSMATPPTAGQSTQTTTPDATHLAAPFPLDMTRDTDDGATAATASATDTGVHVDTDLNPATTGLPADEHISSFLLRIRRRADDKAAGLVLDAAPPDTGAGVAANPAPGITAPVIATGPTTDMDVGTADGLLPDVADFDPTSAWGDGDEVTAAAPDGADFDPTSLDSVWVGGDGATAEIPTTPPRFRNSGAVGRGFRSLDRFLLSRVCS